MHCRSSCPQAWRHHSEVNVTFEFQPIYQCFSNFRLWLNNPNPNVFSYAPWCACLCLLRRPCSFVVTSFSDAEFAEFLQIVIFLNDVFVWKWPQNSLNICKFQFLQHDLASQLEPSHQFVPICRVHSIVSQTVWVACRKFARSITGKIQWFVLLALWVLQLFGSLLIRLEPFWCVCTKTIGWNSRPAFFPKALRKGSF